jgi:D-alanyl-D-alanine carboxypeptidase
MEPTFKAIDAMIIQYRLEQIRWSRMFRSINGWALTCLLAALPAGAVAKTHHHAHVYAHTHTVHPAYTAAPAPVNAGFGPTAPGVSSILIDASYGNVLAATGADVPRYPASLTKLMTLDLAFQALRDGRMTLDTAMPVSYHAASVEPVKLGLPAGGAITVRQAILAMTTMSANDAATTLGEFLGGGSEFRCAQMMTLRAHALGMAQTQFANASGLPDPNQVTTARDLSILARDIVVNFPEDQPFFEVQNFNFNGRTVYSNNAMLKIYPGASGMKTGYTILARHNLITSAVRGNRVLVGVVLHEPSWGETYQTMTAMLDGGFGGHVPGANNLNATLMAANKPQPAAPPAPRPSAAARIAALALPAPAAAATPPAMPSRVAGWTAQLGMFSHMNTARVEAIKVRKLRGVGIARIAKVQSHGKTLWTAQLAGLTQTAAHRTCSVLAARGAACFIIAPQADHLAMRDADNG